MLSLNQIVLKLQNLQENHGQLNDFYFGNPYEIGASNPVTYPLMAAALNPGNLSKRTQSMKLLLVFADLVNKDESNETEVLSDMQLVAMDIYAQLWEYLDDNNISLSPDATFSSFTESWDDEVSGWQIEISIDQFYSRDTCQVPTKDPLTAPPLVPYLSTSLSLANYGDPITLAVNEETDLFYFIGEGITPSEGNVTVTPSVYCEIWNGSSWIGFPSTLTISYINASVITEQIYKVRITASSAAETLSAVAGDQTYNQPFITSN